MENIKKNWERPVASVQMFMPNEYVAACGDGHKTYNFVCNAGLDDNGKPVMGGFPMPTKYVWSVYKADGTNLTEWGAFGPCNATHEADSDDEFIKGYIDNNYTSTEENIPVIIWTAGGTNIHCTTKLDMSEWVTAKS